MMPQRELIKHDAAPKAAKVDGIYVLLPSHTDPELGQPVKHYHRDPRVYGPEIMLIEDRGQPIEMVPDCELPWPEMNIGVPVYLMLLYYYEGMTLHNGKCPHKGITVHGSQCPAHGLRFDPDGKVVGILKDCYLQAGDSVSELGEFGVILHRSDAHIDRVYLMYQEMRLATSPVGPFFVKAGDKSTFTFTLGESNGPQIHPPTSCRNLPQRRSPNTRHALSTLEPSDERNQSK